MISLGLNAKACKSVYYFQLLFLCSYSCTHANRDSCVDGNRNTISQIIMISSQIGESWEKLKEHPCYETFEIANLCVANTRIYFSILLLACNVFYNWFGLFFSFAIIWKFWPLSHLTTNLTYSTAGASCLWPSLRTTKMYLHSIVR